MNLGDHSDTMVDPERLELPTPAFEAQCSIQLSYGSKLLELNDHIVLQRCCFLQRGSFGVTCRCSSPHPICRQLGAGNWVCLQLSN
jgi:hypothetical protein